LTTIAPDHYQLIIVIQNSACGIDIDGYIHRVDYSLTRLGMSVLIALVSQPTIVEAQRLFAHSDSQPTIIEPNHFRHQILDPTTIKIQYFRKLPRSMSKR
jgi:hypothetical protein